MGCQVTLSSLHWIRSYWTLQEWRRCWGPVRYLCAWSVTLQKLYGFGEECMPSRTQCGPVANRFEALEEVVSTRKDYQHAMAADPQLGPI